MNGVGGCVSRADSGGRLGDAPRCLGIPRLNMVEIQVRGGEGGRG